MSGPPEGVIDLGLLRSPLAEIAAVAGRRQQHRGRQGRGGRQGHRGRLPPVVLGLLLSLLGGSVPAITSVATVRLPAEQAQFDVLAGQLLVAEAPTRWAAHDLLTGDRRYPVPVRGLGSSPVLAAGVFVEAGTPLAVDPATGRQRWPAAARGVVDNPLQILPGIGVGLRLGDRRRLDGSLAGGALAHELTGVDLATGEEIWQRSLPAGVNAWLVGDPPIVVTLGGDGVLAVRDATTGRLAASRQVLQPGRDERPLGPVMGSGRRLAFGYRAQESGTVVHGYNVDNLARVWELIAPHPSWLEACGPMLCLHTQPRDPQPGTVEIDPITGVPRPPTEVAVVDPATGAVGWVAGAGVHQVRAVQDRLLRYDALGLLQAVVDPATGEPLRDLRGWQAVAPRSPDGRRLALVRAGGHRPAGADPARAAVAVLDLTTLALTELRWVTGAPDRCLPLPSGLVCRYDHTLQIWNWPRRSTEPG